MSAGLCLSAESHPEDSRQLFLSAASVPTVKLMKRHTDESHSLTGAARIAWRRSVLLCCVGGVQSRGGDGARATVLWRRTRRPLPSRQSADGILGAHYGGLWAVGGAARRPTGGSGRQLSELRPDCSNSLSMGEGWAWARRGKAAVTASDLHECLTPVPKAFA